MPHTPNTPTKSSKDSSPSESNPEPTRRVYRTREPINGADWEGVVDRTEEMEVMDLEEMQERLKAKGVIKD